MLILPLPAQADWSRPPYATLGLILLCCFVLLVLQGKDDARWAAAQRAYAQSSLPRLELPRYVEALAARGKTREAEALKGALRESPGAVLLAMEADTEFMQALRSGHVVEPTHAEYAQWQQDRQRYETLRAAIFTQRYSLQPHQPSLLTAITSMFLHADFMHLAGNMVILFMVGCTVEAALGARLYLALFVLGGLAATLPDLMIQRPGFSLGASGAISAVMASYLVLFGRRRIRFFYWFIFFFNTARWPALVILPVWIGNELLQNYVFDRDGQVNYLAHFAGLLGGALLTAGYRLQRRGRSAQMVHQADAREALFAARQRALAHVAQMRFDRAVFEYRNLAEQACEAQDLVEYLRVAHLHGKSASICDAAQRVVQRVGAGSRSISAEQLVQALSALDGLSQKPPLMNLEASARVARRLLKQGSADHLEYAEDAVLASVARDSEGRVAAALLDQLAAACDAAGQTQRAQTTRALRARRYPNL